MLSLKPPWKQKNPLMEKACQAYYKQTAPAEAVEILDKMKVREAGKKLEEEIVHSTSNNVNKVTVLFKDEDGYPSAVGVLLTKEGKIYILRMAKFKWGPKIDVFYKGERILRLPRKKFAFQQYKP